MVPALFALKHSIRVALAYVLFYTGVLHGIKRRRLRGRAVVLMYHRVLTEVEHGESFSSDGIVVRPETFARHMAWLKRNFTVVAPTEMLRRMRERVAFDDATCVVTFDDGWTDNYDNALPALRRFGVPAIVFLPTHYIGASKTFWQERLARDLTELHALHRRTPTTTERFVNEHGLGSVFATPRHLRRRIHDYVRNLKHRPDRDVVQLQHAVSELLASNGAGATASHPDRFLGWEQVRTMRDAGVDFGSHAQSHRVLTRLTTEELREELIASKREIETRLQRPIPLFAYPNGDFDSRVAEAVARAGYAAAFTTQPGSIAATDDPYTLRRVNIHERQTRHLPLFYATLLGVL